MLPKVITIARRAMLISIAEGNVNPQNKLLKVRCAGDIYSREPGMQ